MVRANQIIGLQCSHRVSAPLIVAEFDLPLHAEKWTRVHISSRERALRRITLLRRKVILDMQKIDKDMAKVGGENPRTPTPPTPKLRFL